MPKYFNGKISGRSVKNGVFSLRFRVRFHGLRAVEFPQVNGLQARGWLSDQLTARLVDGCVKLRLLAVDKFGRALAVTIPALDLMPTELIGGRAGRMPDFLAKLNHVVDGDTADFSVKCTALLFVGLEDWAIRKWLRAASNPSAVAGGYLVRFTGLGSTVEVVFGENVLPVL